MIETDALTRDIAAVRSSLSAGRGAVGYWSYVALAEYAAEHFPDAQVWYTERNGDPIGLLAPAGTPPEELPRTAMQYFVFEWIHPDADFGSGVRML